MFKTKREAKGQVESYKSRLVAKSYNQREGVGFKETFSPISTKDYLGIIMAIVAHSNLELHHMNVRTTFLDGDLAEEVYMSKPFSFKEAGKETMVCKLQKSIYGLKQVSKQWYLKFDKVVTTNGFKENTVDQCIFMKVSGSKYIFLVLYVDDIFLTTNDTGLLVETKQLLFSHFDKKNLGKASYVLGIQILRDRSSGILILSRPMYVEHILKMFNM